VVDFGRISGAQLLVGRRLVLLIVEGVRLALFAVVVELLVGERLRHVRDTCVANRLLGTVPVTRVLRRQSR